MPSHEGNGISRIRVGGIGHQVSEVEQEIGRFEEVISLRSLLVQGYLAILDLGRAACPERVLTPTFHTELGLFLFSPKSNFNKRLNPAFSVYYQTLRYLLYRLRTQEYRPEGHGYTRDQRMDEGNGGGGAFGFASDSDVRTDPAWRVAGGPHRGAKHPRESAGARAFPAGDLPRGLGAIMQTALTRERQAIGARELALAAHRTLFNGGDTLQYFRERGLAEEVVRVAYIGFAAGAFLYPCVAREGGLLAVHCKSKARDGRGKRRPWWKGYADDLPPKGCGRSPEDPAKVVPFGMESLKNLRPGALVVLACGEED